MTIDWSKAPEGATHCDESTSSPQWYKKVAGGWHFEYDNCWYVSNNKPDYNERLTPRPVVAAWRGPQDGLPPVGMEVEAQDGYSWKKGTVVARVWEACYGDMAIIQCEGFWAASDATGIRPIKTERERAIEEIEAVVKQAFCAQMYGEKASQVVALALYDAGYRKGEPT
jgi:hypothetical protein